MSEALIKSRSIKDLVRGEDCKARLKEIMGERSGQFAAALVQLVNGSEALQACEPNTVMGAAIMAAALDLSVDPNIGEAHIVPYDGRAQFQLGFKGFIQLAMRSGEYKSFGSTVVKEGELIHYDELTGELVIDKTKKVSELVIGYAAKFKLLNGFERGEFWTVDEIEYHALTYSKSYRYSKGKPDKEKKCLWVTKRDEMAIKTVEKSLLNHYGPKSIQMRKAIKMDGGAVMDVDSETVAYIDNETEPKVSKPVFSPLTEHEMEPPVATEPPLSETTVLPEKPSKTGGSEPKEGYNKYKAVKGFLTQAGLKEQDLIDGLLELGAIDESVKTVDAIPKEVMDMAESQHDELIQRIKKMKGIK